MVVGDADAVSVGDFHLKHLVAWALASEPRGTDDRMLELLEPYAGHRGRVCIAPRVVRHDRTPSTAPARPSSPSPTADDGGQSSLRATAFGVTCIAGSKAVPLDGPGLAAAAWRAARHGTTGTARRTCSSAGCWQRGHVYVMLPTIARAR